LAVPRGGVVKVVILAGGYGTRLSEETDVRPKPMVEIGGRPLLWHLMKFFEHYGHRDFIVCLGYKGFVVKEYFANYRLHNSDLTVELAREGLTFHSSPSEDWRITLVDTGLDTMTGGRLRRVRSHLDDQPFLLTYGDGLGAVDLDRLVQFHRRHGKAATVTSVQPPGRFGVVEIGEGDTVRGFHEKPVEAGGWINAGFFVMNPSALAYLDGDDTILETHALARMAEGGELMAFRHTGFWKPMDTLRDKRALQALWDEGHAPWKLWS
jgi:glucose-1-phosphate cytidylyltransferase